MNLKDRIVYVEDLLDELAIVSMAHKHGTIKCERPSASKFSDEFDERIGRHTPVPKITEGCIKRVIYEARKKWRRNRK